MKLVLRFILYGFIISWLLSIIALNACALGSTPVSIESLRQQYSNNLHGWERWCKSNLKYVSDEEHEARRIPIMLSPKEVVKYGEGDCDDFARLHNAVLSGCPFNEIYEVILFANTGKAHAVAIVHQSSRWYFFDNLELIRLPSAKSLINCIDLVDSGWDKALIKYKDYSTLVRRCS